MKRSSRPRATDELSKSVNHQLTMYALAASTAGVGLLALSQPSQAKIVYTHAHHVIRKNGSYPIDLNHDGISELILQNVHFHRGLASGNLVRQTPSFSESVAVETIGSRPSSFLLDAALRRGTRVGSNEPFPIARGVLVAQCTHGTSDGSPPCYSLSYNRVGVWGNVKDHYLGLRFQLLGKIHYGWVRMSVEVSRNPVKATATVTGYAYETVPNRPIIAGRTKGPDVITVYPVTLGRLAAGTAIPAWRSGK